MENMTRRSFLRCTLAGVAAVVAAPVLAHLPKKSLPVLYVKVHKRSAEDVARQQYEGRLKELVDQINKYTQKQDAYFKNRYSTLR